MLKNARTQWLDGVDIFYNIFIIKRKNKSFIKNRGDNVKKKGGSRKKLLVIIFCFCFGIACLICGFVLKNKNKIYDSKKALEDFVEHEATLHGSTQKETKNENDLSDAEKIDNMEYGEAYAESGNTNLETLENSYKEEELTYKEYAMVKKVENVELSNIKVGKVHNSKCLLIADTKNISNDLQNSKIIGIKAIDEEGNVKDKFTGILKELAKGEKGKLKVQVLADITYAVDFEFEFLE